MPNNMEGPAEDAVAKLTELQVGDGVMVLLLDLALEQAGKR